MKYPVIIILLLVSQFTLAQHKRRLPGPPVPNPQEELRSDIAGECYFSNRYSVAQRRNIYPFKNADKVLLISFNEEQGGVPVNHGHLNNSKTLEQLLLTTSQTDSLTNILYNIGFTPIEGGVPMVSEASCYEPRNGIIFMDKAGRAFAFIEICFGCQRTRVFPEKIKQGEYCSTKFELLRNFFSTTGIKYGTQDRDSVMTYQQIFNLDTSSYELSIENALEFDVFRAVLNKLNKKAQDGKTLSHLSETEKTLLFAANAEWIYRGYPGLSGFAQFYSHWTGNYYWESITALKRVGANLLAKVMQDDLQHWPGGKIPTDQTTRRAELLKIANKTDPAWQKTMDKLYDYKYGPGSREDIQKEDLAQLIYNYLHNHRAELVD